MFIHQSYYSSLPSRFSRQAPEDVPQTRVARQSPDDVPQEPPARFTRQSPDDVPQEPPKRIARQTQEDVPKRLVRQVGESELEKPQHIRQEAFYSSITSLSRNKRGSSINGGAARA